MTDLLKILGVTGALAAFFQLANYGGKHWSWPAEFRRKLVHIGMGAVVIWFPWIFDSIWPVWILATLSMAAFCLLRVLAPLQRRFGEVLYGVKRQSWGEFCWPFSVALLFSLTHAQPLFYVIPVLILALADTGGAMVGTRYGSAQYQTDDGQKSAEGSLAVFLVAFLATHISLLLFTQLGRLECLLIGFILGLIATLTEAIAWRGLDNFFVPIATYACLVRLAELGVTILVIHLMVLILLLVALHFCILRTYLTRSASTAAALVLYVSWTAGNWHWLIAPLATLTGYVALCPDHQTQPKMHNVEAITLVASAGLLWLALSHLLPTFDTLYAYGVAYGANLSFIALAFFAHRSRRLPLLVAGVLSWTLGYTLLAIPYFMVWHEHPHVLTLSLAAALTLAICLGIFMKWQPSLRDSPNDSARWLRQTAMAGLASLVAFFVINSLGVDHWWGEAPERSEDISRVFGDPTTRHDSRPENAPSRRSIMCQRVKVAHQGKRLRLRKHRIRELKEQPSYVGQVGTLPGLTMFGASNHVTPPMLSVGLSGASPHQWSEPDIRAAV